VTRNTTRAGLGRSERKVGQAEDHDEWLVRSRLMRYSPNQRRTEKRRMAKPMFFPFVLRCCEDPGMSR